MGLLRPMALFAEAYAAYGANLEAGLDGNIDSVAGPQVGSHDQAQPSNGQLQGEVYAPYGSMEAPAYAQYASDQPGGESEHEAWAKSRGNSEYNYDDGGYSDGLGYDDRSYDRDYGCERHRSRDRDYDRDGDRDRDRDRYRDRRREPSPSPTLYMRGLPENCTEGDVRHALEGESLPQGCNCHHLNLLLMALHLRF
jgi:hypothetical protein